MENAGTHCLAPSSNKLLPQWLRLDEVKIITVTSILPTTNSLATWDNFRKNKLHLAT